MIEIKVPPMGESITEATVAGWRKQPGENFAGGDILVELETDKVTMEVPAPSAGFLKEVLKGSGEIVHVNEILALMEEGKSQAAQSAGSASAVPESSSMAPAPNPEEIKNLTLPPGARRLAEENRLDPSDISGSGRHGQVTKSDVVQHLEKKETRPAYSPPAPSQAPVRQLAPGERETIVPMTKLRQKIAERLVQAQHTAAMLTTFNEIDMTAAMEMRGKYKDRFKEVHGVGLGFMSIFTKACVDALKTFRAINGEIRGTDIVYKNYYDIGVAVGGPKGLVVPIVRSADMLSFAEIEKEIARLALRVKDGTITVDELLGGTFTISNGGIYGSMLSTPIINPPQCGILGMHNIVKRAVVIGDEIKIRPMMYAALSYDHRIVDGKEAVSFLVRVKECVENPERMMLGV